MKNEFHKLPALKPDEHVKVRTGIYNDLYALRKKEGHPTGRGPAKEPQRKAPSARQAEPAARGKDLSVEDIVGWAKRTIHNRDATLAEAVLALNIIRGM